MSQKKKIAVLVPCYKRPEYTIKCIASLEKTTCQDDVVFFLVDAGSGDMTPDILKNANIPNKQVRIYHIPTGLRDLIIDFFEETKGFDYIAKIDNDCAVSPDWLSALKRVYEQERIDILSPNVMPSNAAERLGHGTGDFLKSQTIGGLWFMRRSLLDNMEFEKTGMVGVYGAHALLEQIQIENDCLVGWTKKVTVQDLGHWSGFHVEHIKSEEHRMYSEEVGRKVAW